MKREPIRTGIMAVEFIDYFEKNQAMFAEKDKWDELSGKETKIQKLIFELGKGKKNYDELTEREQEEVDKELGTNYKKIYEEIQALQ